MSEGNADRARAMYELLNRGEVDAALEMYAPGFEVDFSRSLTGMNGVYTDRDVLKSEWIAHWIDPWEWMEIDVVDLVELDEIRVLAVTRGRMRGRGSGAEVEAKAAAVWTFGEDGKVTRGVFYQSRDDALAAFRAGA